MSNSIIASLFWILCNDSQYPLGLSFWSFVKWLIVCWDSFPLNVKTPNIYSSRVSHFAGTPPIRNLTFYGVPSTGWGTRTLCFPYLRFALAITGLPGSFVTLPLHSLQREHGQNFRALGEEGKQEGLSARLDHWRIFVPTPSQWYRINTKYRITSHRLTFNFKMKTFKRLFHS